MIQVKNVKLDTAALDAYAKSIDVNTDRALAAIAFQVEGYAKPLTPFETGALRNGIKAEPMPGKPHTYWVHDSVEYGIFWELGFHQSVFGKFQMIKLSQKPFMVPATEMAARDVNNAFKKELGEK